MNNPKPQEWLAADLEQGYVSDYKPFNFVDGEGVRCSLYLSGCKFHCEGCYNQATWNFRYGSPYTKELEERIMADLSQSYVQGLTLLGVSLSSILALLYRWSNVYAQNFLKRIFGLGRVILGKSFYKRMKPNLSFCEILIYLLTVALNSVRKTYCSNLEALQINELLM